ncbi:Protein of unknown function [Nakamurella panacisegetis]|uniref:DinB superfamily protein n=1 Tax=Nakamurella panacisegetis TaxID=1090615 RepID=A0A1H0KCD1_9ACTN|nr:DinB family protein [Nakamurella panacisegetis]SDO53574.1 Protein of unknown function [Nakamurella panacisegetis]
MSSTETIIDERADLLEILRTRRRFLIYTANGLTHEQAAAAPTVSALCIGGLIKHVAKTEAGWLDFIEQGPSAMDGGKPFSEWGEAEFTARANEFKLLPEESLDGVLAAYAAVAIRTEALLTSLPDLGVSQPLPTAPWFKPGARQSARQVFLHIACETAQHAGHADIIREAIDGQKTMG